MNQIKKTIVSLAVVISTVLSSFTSVFAAQNGLSDQSALSTMGKVTQIQKAISPESIKVTGLKAVPAGKNKVQLSWNKVSKATWYIITAKKNGVYQTVGYTNKNTYLDRTASDTAYNFYWVFALVPDGSKTVTSAAPKYVYSKGTTASVSQFTAANTTKGVTLKWNKVADADGYVVYGKQSGQTFHYIGMTSQTSYTDTKASLSNYNFYWVYPFHYDAKGKVVLGQISPKYVYGKKKASTPSTQLNSSSTGGATGSSTGYPLCNVYRSTDPYVVNVNTHKFHKSTCREVKKINSENKYSSSASAAMLLKYYSACKICKP